MKQHPDPINLSHSKPPLAIAATNARFLSTFPNGKDQLWSADIKLCRYDVECSTFKDILFVQSGTTVFIYGIENEDGAPVGLRADLAKKQQDFIHVLRAENESDNRTLGWSAVLFSDHEYSSEGKATAAFLAQRDEKLNMGVGYRSAEGEYKLDAIDPTDDWMPLARSILPFDLLGKGMAN